MKPQVVVATLCALFTLSQQAPSKEKCVCELTSSEKAFPYDKLGSLEGNAVKCNSDVTSQKARKLQSLMLGLERRLPQLAKDIAALDSENDEQMYAAISLQLVNNELSEIQRLMDELNSTTLSYQRLSASATQQLKGLRGEMGELEAYDSMQVVKRQQDNRRLTRDLQECRTGHQHIVQPTRRPRGACPHGKFDNVTGPRVNTAGEYPGSYKYGAWGRDPRPAAGTESWYWRVILVSSNRHGHYVRLYTSLSSLIVGVSTPGNIQISPSNPATNTIQGPNAVMYDGALYYNCYNQDSVCRFNTSTKTVTTVKLPAGTRYNSKSNFCTLDECYPYTDLDLATDESGVWVIYTTAQDFGNLVLAKVEDTQPPQLGQPWRTSVYKSSVSNTFMACGVLYATRYIDKSTEEIFYSFDTSTGEENFKVGVFLHKVSPNIISLNYSPVDQMLHAYCDSIMVSYKVLFS